jgi:hypothetical protein
MGGYEGYEGGGGGGGGGRGGGEANSGLVAGTAIIDVTEMRQQVHAEVLTAHRYRDRTVK